MGKHVDRLGRALTNAVSTYNQAVGSLESRVLVSARRLNQLGVVDGELDTPGLVEETARALSAPELAAESGPELVTDPVPQRAAAAAQAQAGQEHGERRAAPDRAVAAR
jgi:DNA recombination protein RmuC